MRDYIDKAMSNWCSLCFDEQIHTLHERGEKRVDGTIERTDESFGED